MVTAGLVVLAVLLVAVFALPFARFSVSGATVAYGALTMTFSVPAYLLGAWQGLLVFIPLGALFIAGGVFVRSWA